MRVGLGPDQGTCWYPFWPLKYQKASNNVKLLEHFSFILLQFCIEIKFGAIPFGKADGVNKC